MKYFLLLSMAFWSPAAAQPPQEATLSGPATSSADEDGLGPALVDLRASARPFVLSPGADGRYDIGIALMYRLEFDKAEAKFREIIALDPESPAGYCALAALSWWRYSQNFDMESALKDVEKEFLSNSDRAIVLSKKMLEEGRDLDQAYFFMGSAYGLQGRWYAVQRSWFKAYGRGKKARRFLKKCVEANPAIYDAYLGLGIFDYYAATLPGALGFAAHLFVGGDRARGMEYVKLARDKGRFFKLEARIFLIEIYSRHEGDYRAAFAECEALRAQDPSNMLFRLAELMAFLKAQYWPGVLAGAESFLGAWQVSPQRGLEQQLGSVYLAAGDALIGLKRYGEAIVWLSGGIEKTGFPEKGWVTYCYLRRAQAQDLAGLRETALADYKTVLARPNFWDSRKYAKAGIKKAADYQEVMLQMTQD